MAAFHPRILFKKYPILFIAGLLLSITVVVGTIITLNKSFTKEEVLASTIKPTVQPSQPTLEIFETPVEIKLPNGTVFETAKNNQHIPEGTEIRTGETGRAQVVFASGTATRIDNNGDIKIKYTTGPENIVITILQGRVWSRIKKLLGNETYETETSNLVATVRGTSYGHGIVEGGFDKGTVFKGIVEMKCKNDIGELEVTPNKKALVNCDEGTGLELLDFDIKDKTDEWLSFNKYQDALLESRFGKDTYDDDTAVLGAATSVSPTPYLSATTGPTKTPYPTSRPTDKPASTNTTANTATPVPSNTPTVTPSVTPSPVPILPIITNVSEDAALIRTLIASQISGGTVIVVEGENLANATISLDSGEFAGYEGQKTDKRVVAKFAGVSCGNHTVTASVAEGSASKPITISSAICLPL